MFRVPKALQTLQSMFSNLCLLYLDLLINGYDIIIMIYTIIEWEVAILR
jgi:hypothetical protein